eukprot:jgi/Tetstr1/426570/TSEL_001646.t1
MLAEQAARDAKKVALAAKKKQEEAQPEKRNEWLRQLVMPDGRANLTKFHQYSPSKAPMFNGMHQAAGVKNAMEIDTDTPLAVLFGDLVDKNNALDEDAERPMRYQVRMNGPAVRGLTHAEMWTQLALGLVMLGYDKEPDRPGDCDRDYALGAAAREGKTGRHATKERPAGVAIHGSEKPTLQLLM